MPPLPGLVLPHAVRSVALALLAFAISATSLEAQRSPTSGQRRSAARSTGRAPTRPDTAALQVTCGRPKSAACLSMAYLLLAGRPFPADTARAVGFMERACTAGDARACGQAAWMYRQGQGLRADTAKALTLFSVACQRGDARSCTSQGYMHEIGAGTPRDAAQAATFYDRGCKAGDPRGCGNLANVRDSSQQVLLPAGASSVSLLRAACTRKDALACTNLGVLHETGRGVRANPTRAVALYTRACQDNVLEACLNLGKLTALGRGVTRPDPIQAARLFTQSCDGNLAVACANLAVLSARGSGMARDTARAKVLYAKACTLGDTIACRRAQRP
jgi:TPR repeat protein